MDDGWKGNAATRCTAHRKNGDRCKRQARRGANVCDAHGGRAPQVKRRAHQRLEESADRMAKQLLGIADSGESEAVRLAAIKHALALGGITEKTSVEVSVAEPAPWQGMLAGIARVPLDESQRRRGLIEPPRELTAADPAEPVDAEVVPDPNPPAQPDGPLRPPPWAGVPQPPASSGGELLTMEDAAAFTADLRRQQGQPRRVRSERFK
ncbi:hypothetical protein ASE48_22505 [Mycobacterium sp. Root265]|nr:hypothetical protein ASE48_22505 [Mycobacterium sp. Root265]